MRALSGAQGFALAVVNGHYRPIGWAGRSLFFIRSLLQLLLAALLALLSWPFGRHHAATWLVRAWANLGKLSVLWGWRSHIYVRKL